MWCCCTGAVLLYALLLWNLITPAMRMRSFRSGAKQGLFSAGGVLLTFSFLMSLFMHVVIVVALGYHSVYLTTTPILLASFVLFLAKSCVDEEFRTWMLGPKLTHCLISGIFPVTTPRPESKMGNKQENNGFVTAKVKMAGNELFFVYLLHLVILALGMVGFTLLTTDPEYAEKMIKLKEASTISMEVMVYAACPMAFLLGVLSQLVFRQYFDPWKLVRSRIEPGCCPGSCQDCNPKPISRVVQRTVPLQSSNDCSAISMEETRENPEEETRENPEEENREISGEENQEILSEENRETPAEEVEGAGAVAAELGEIF